jgi:hypothetical protein
MAASSIASSQCVHKSVGQVAITVSPPQDYDVNCVVVLDPTISTSLRPRMAARKSSSLSVSYPTSWTTWPAAAGTRRHTGTYPAEPRQVGLALAGWLGGCPQADEAILVASEFATNSVLHSASRCGGAFTLRAEVSRDRLRIEVEDAGGLWRDGSRDDGRPHGFDVVAAIAGAGNWGVDGDARGRVAWARLGK